MQISALLKNILLPPIFRLIRNVFRESSFSDLDYQGIRLPFIMSRIHLGEFAKIHEKYTSLDSHINFNSNITRLRIYYVVEFCRMALMNAKFYEIPKSRIENHEDNVGGGSYLRG